MQTPGIGPASTRQAAPPVRASLPEVATEPADSLHSCPYLRAQQKLQAVAQAVDQATTSGESLALTGYRTALAASTSLTPSTSSLASALGMRFQAPARFANLAAYALDTPTGRWKNVSADQAIEKAVKHKTLRVRASGAQEWLPVKSLEELQALVSASQQQAVRDGRLESALAAASQVASSASFGGLWRLGGSPNSTMGPQTEKVGALPFLRGAARFSEAPVSFLQEFHAKYGPSFEVNLPGLKPLLFDTRREVISAALRETDNGQETWTKSKVQGHGASFLIGEKNMFLSNGEDWHSIHEAIRPHLAGKIIMSDVTHGKLTDIFDEHIQDLKTRVEAAPGGKLEIDPRREMQGAVLDVAFQVFMGVKLPRAELKEVQNAFNTQMEWLNYESVNPSKTSLAELPGFAKLRGAYDKLNSVADRIVSQRKEAMAQGKPVSDDMLTTFIKTVDPATGQPFDDQRLRHEVLSLIEAGHETTATMIGWSLTMLGRHPQAQQKLQQEVDETFAGARPANSKAVRNLTQPELITQETLRMFPAFFLFMREAKVDTTIGPENAPVHVRQGTTLITSLYEQQRDEKVWGTEATGYPAHEFHPERFAEKAPPLLSFGAGKRGCVGQAMGKLEGQLMLTRFSQQFDVEAANHDPIVLGSDLSIHPTNGNVILSARKCPFMQSHPKTGESS